MIQWFAERLAYAGAWAGLRAGSLMVRIFPGRLLFSASDRLADLALYLFRGFRRRSTQNLSVAFGEKLDGREIQQTVQSSLRNFFRDFVEIGIALESSPEELRAQIDIVGHENLEAALAKGKGVIALSAHLGNFFLAGTRLAVEGYPIHVLVNQPRNGRFSELLDRYRLRLRQRTIHARPRREASQELLQVLRRNELAIVIADEYRSGRGIPVPFFGRTVLARRGPATLALRTGAAVVPVCLIRDSGGGLKLVIEPELELLRAGKGKTAVRENTLRMTQWLERTVRAYPGQWNWMNVKWQGAPNEDVIAKEHRFQDLIH